MEHFWCKAIIAPFFRGTCDPAIELGDILFFVVDGDHDGDHNMNRKDTTGQPISMRNGCGCCFGFSRFLSAFNNGICEAQFRHLDVNQEYPKVSWDVVINYAACNSGSRTICTHVVIYMYTFSC
jgi:hypothetical protein